jgi:hypothetical protein
MADESDVSFNSPTHVSCSTSSMKDDLKDNGARDRHRIEEEESWELRWFAQELGVRGDELGEAVKQARLIVSSVKQHLGRY